MHLSRSKSFELQYKHKSLKGNLVNLEHRAGLKILKQIMEIPSGNSVYLIDALQSIT